MSKVLRLEITDKCNLKCAMCWSTDWNHADLTFDELKTIIEEYAKYEPNGTVVLTSREPLLSRNFIPTLELCTNLNLDIKILTNCTLINDKFCEAIMQNNVSFISTSIHGTEKEHDTVTGVKGSYKLTVKGLMLLDKYRKKYNKDLELRITTIFRKTLSNSINEILELANKCDASLRIQHMMWHSLDTKKLNQYLIQEKYHYSDSIICGFPNESDIEGNDVISIIDVAKKYCDNNGIDFQVYPDLVEKEIISWYNNETKKDCGNYCDHSKNSIRVRANGDVTFCQYIDRTFGNLKTDTLQDIIYENPIYDDMCNQFLNGELMPICYKCCHCRNKVKMITKENHKI